MQLQVFKARLTGATKGHKLLKKKRDALKAKFQLLLKEIVQTKMAVGQGLKDAAFSLAKANWAIAGDEITATVIERARRPSVMCKLKADNVAGVSIPSFQLMHDPLKDTAVETLGVASGGAVIKSCRETYFKAVAALVNLASLQTAFKTLDEEIKMTSRRVNALEYVLIPRIEDIVHYIDQEMDEQAREEFFRVLKVVEKKKKKLEIERLQTVKDNAEKAAMGKSVAPILAPMDVPSALDSTGKDEDVVF
jgi:V-type H+-transporting ATPase subunit D